MRRPASLLAFILFSVVAACSNLLSIKDAEVDPTFQSTGATGNPSNGTGSDTLEALCGTYCDTVMAHCTMEMSVYTTKDACMAVCSHLPAGKEGDTTGNSIHCRLRSAELAEAETTFYCPAAGPGGNGTCGTNCEALCKLTHDVCDGGLAPWPDDGACESACGSLPDLGTYSTDDSKEMYEGGHVQCRLFHVSAAALADAQVHCPHVGGAAPCVEAGGAGPK